APGQLANGAARVVLVEWSPHGSVGQHALGHLADEPARNQRRRLLDLQVVDLVALLAPDDENVTKAARGEQSDPMSLALDDNVGAECGAVNDLGDLVPADGRRQLVE